MDSLPIAQDALLLSHQSQGSGISGFVRDVQDARSDLGRVSRAALIENGA